MREIRRKSIWEARRCNREGTIGKVGRMHESELCPPDRRNACMLHGMRATSFKYTIYNYYNYNNSNFWIIKAVGACDIRLCRIVRTAAAETCIC